MRVKPPFQHNTAQAHADGTPQHAQKIDRAGAGGQQVLMQWPQRAELQRRQYKPQPDAPELWGRYWVFAHNGDLKGFAPRLHGSFRPVGDTDSELAFCWLMQELAKAHASVPSIEELRCTLAELLPIPASHGSFNCLLSNGQALWAHCSTQLHWLERRHPFGAAHLADDDLSVDFAALTTPGDRVALVATQPLTTGEDWVAFEAGELRVFVAGRATIGSASADGLCRARS